jgi:hypothetical protein
MARGVFYMPYSCLLHILCIYFLFKCFFVMNLIIMSSDKALGLVKTDFKVISRSVVSCAVGINLQG